MEYSINKKRDLTVLILVIIIIWIINVNSAKASQKLVILALPSRHLIWLKAYIMWSDSTLNEMSWLRHNIFLESEHSKNINSKFQIQLF